MRLSITLTHQYDRLFVPKNDLECLSALIYHVVGNSSSEYSEQLHAKGYFVKGTAGRNFKLFSFSPLRLPKGYAWEYDDFEMSTDSRSVYFILSSPVQEFIEHFIVGLMHQQFVRIGSERLRVESVKRLELPDFSQPLEFINFAPIVCSTRYDNHTQRTYLFPSDADFERVLLFNLLHKYEALHGKPFDAQIPEFKFLLNSDYAERKNIIKLNTIKKGRPDETHIKGTVAPFQLKAPKELIELGYLAGFGEKNALGFGFVKHLRIE
jgi:CRISPR-associated endoribonuclease Cas6